MKKYLTLLEIGLAIAAFLGFLMRLQGLHAGAFLLMGGLGTLAIGYLLELLLPIQANKASFSIIHSKVGVLSTLSAILAMVGLLFKLMLWLPLDNLLRYALYGFLASILGLLFNFRISQKVEAIRYYRQALQRSLIITATAFIIYITPARQLVKRYYAQEPQEIQKQYQRLELDPEGKKKTPPKPN